MLKLDRFIKLQRTAWRSPIDLSRKLVLSGAFCFLFFLGAVNKICMWLDPFLFPGLRKVQVRKPVFIIAHPRSGTTLTHRLMLKDPGRYSYTRAYELLLPSVLEKKLVRALGWIDRRLLGEALHRWVRSKEGDALGELQDIHHASLLEAEEDEFFYWTTFGSSVAVAFFPYTQEFADVMTFDRMPPELQKEHMAYYDACLERQLYLDGPGKIFCGKNTTPFIYKIEVLAQMYPDARFIHIVRNPLEVAPSLLSLLASTWRRFGFSEEEIRVGCRDVHETNMTAYELAFQVFDRMDPGRYVILDYREIASAPKATMQKVYETLGLEMTPEYEAILADLEAKARSHQSGHSYGLEEYGLEEADIRAAAPTVFERYAFD